MNGSSNFFSAWFWVMRMNMYKQALSLLCSLINLSHSNAAAGLTLSMPLPMRCILSLSLFSLVSIARCLTLAPDVLTNQISSSNNPGSSSPEYDLPGQGLSEIADASNDGCTPGGAATGKAAERRNLMARGKVCLPLEQEKRPAGTPFPPSSRPPSKFNPDLPGHLDNLPESYPLLHLKPNELNLDEEICPPSIAGQRKYAYCDTGLSLDRIIHDKFEPKSWDLLRCEDFNPITGCFFGMGGYQSSVWCCHEQTTTNHDYFGQIDVCIDCIPYLQLWEPLPSESY